ncbi:MAG TPA: GNAT family N-acetyltransferase [Gemmataceae bacterium]|nr:GNAT family N-acetyltransferase [Gemmataceae bacterium]
MIRVRAMTAADLPFGLHLSESAGWNQTEGDWQRFLDLQPDGCFVAECDGMAVGTTTTCIFGSVAWVAMVLVEESARGRGVGTALMRHALEFLDGRGIATVRLDARPMAQSIYERLGFVEQYRIAHYEGTIPHTPEVAGGESAPVEWWESLMALDEQFTHTDRRRLLWRLFSECPQDVHFIHLGPHDGGYLTSRPGKKTFRLGPCIAAASAGPSLLADAWHRYSGQLISLDVPLANVAAKQWVESHGLTVQHTLTRMCRGVQVCEQVESLWLSSGPEKG